MFLQKKYFKQAYYFKIKLLLSEMIERSKSPLQKALPPFIQKAPEA
jgi:hypothetical protein